MRYLSNFINNIFVKNQAVSLGRWNIVYCQEKINKKVDLSNEDHCGTCSNFNFTSSNTDNKKSQKYDVKSLIFFETM
jgi:hypothetical protein